MDEKELSELKTELAALKASNDELTKAIKSAPAVDNSGVVVTKDEGDRPFTSLAEEAQAVKAATLSNGRNIDKRLLRVQEMAVKANGANESVPADAG